MHPLILRCALGALCVAICHVTIWNGTGLSAAEPLPRVPATEPAKATETLVLQDGFRAELVAAEPLVTDPVALKYDENGRAYVVEMNDYPYADKSYDKAWENQDSPPLGRIRLLVDSDGDGVFDRSTVFADKLSWPAGLALWKGGVYVAATPDVLYLKDTNGDGRADLRRTVFSGFRKYNVQAVMNNFQWGLDHRIYAAGSGNGGDIRRDGMADPIPLRRGDFRFDPREESLEVISGGARFGNTFDDWGNRFLCNIRNPVQQIVLPARYLARHRYLPVASVLHNVVASGDTVAVYPISPPEPWRVVNALRQAAAPETRPPHDSTVASGFVTSSSGVTIYRGAAYPAEYQGNAFVGEVAGNLVLRYRLSRSAVGFQGVRGGKAKQEFLASRDNWFRPVNFVNAPDGTLHVLDMYRETIEHPWSMPDDLKQQVDLTSGRDRGRIYRLVPKTYADGFEPPPRPRLGEASVAELVSELENPNAWWRETAHRLLFEQQDAAAVEPLRKLLQTSTRAVARLHALWSLEGLNQLRTADLQTALQDKHPAVRAHAVRLAESRWQTEPQLGESVLPLANDADAQVRFQCALSLGNLKHPNVAGALTSIARKDAEDSWIRTAVLSSLGDSGADFLQDVLVDQSLANRPGGREIVAQLAFAVGVGNQTEAARRVLKQLASQPRTERQQVELQRHVLANLGRGLKRAGKTLRSVADQAPTRALVETTMANARRQATDRELAVSEREAAIELLSFSDLSSVEPLLDELLDARQPKTVQLAALAAMTSFPNPAIGRKILDRYPSLTPSLRSEAISRLLTRQDWLQEVLEAVAAGSVSATHISWVRRDIYMKHSNPAIREQAKALFGKSPISPRKEVVAQYEDALTMTGDVARAQGVLKRECLTCHRWKQEGKEVGPDLATVRHRSPAELLLHILDPNREVSPNYLEYVVATRRGQVHTGVIASETANGLTLRQAEGKQQLILRDEIAEIRSSGKSLMPEGLEKKVNLQQMADLITLLRSTDP